MERDKFDKAAKLDKRLQELTRTISRLAHSYSIRIHRSAQGDREELSLPLGEEDYLAVKDWMVVMMEGKRDEIEAEFKLL